MRVTTTVKDESFPMGLPAADFDVVADALGMNTLGREVGRTVLAAPRRVGPRRRRRRLRPPRRLKPNQPSEGETTMTKSRRDQAKAIKRLRDEGRAWAEVTT